MNTIIKGTKTIEEFKTVQKSMEELALKKFEEHKQDFEKWSEGDIKKVWFDHDGNFCIEYQSGNWWHYNDKGEWW